RIGIARTIAHEVRNPLTNISLAAEQVRELGESTEDRDLLLDMIDRSATRINQLVSDLLNSTRVEQLEYIQTDINILIDEALELAQDRLDLSHINLSKDYSSSLPGILIDTGKIKLAFLNIIVNAIESIEGGRGELSIRTYAANDKCHIEFRDNGIGMDEDTQLKLFEPYFTGKPQGNGLGLTHTQAIILNHKGSINVYSKPGQGSTFTIILPFNIKQETDL
ncbi:MAG: histidine kinase, partial [Chitinophagaceae bacterium]